MSALKVLITNLKLEGWTGTELFVRDVARGLLAAGHRPVIYSPHLGKLAAEIHKETIPFVDPKQGRAHCGEYRGQIQRNAFR